MAGTKGKQSVRNMILSLGVITLMASVIYLFIPHGEGGTPDVKRVDYRVELLTARRAAPYPVAAPEGLPKTWKATSVRYDGSAFDAWHLGFHAPDGEYVAIEQSTQKPAVFIDTASGGARETKATERIGDRTWQRYEGGRYDALVLKAKGSTTVVAGTGSFAQLAKMAQSLKAESTKTT
ncbi:DUF4245 domain-containing protein [Streptomyces sp. R21]|uniref:DUF4245 domain-containing protein n=1 Tax=Streptomyces sp. R21 TaxID=3238627 RepID=A0AB39P7U0_9ACTN